MNKLDERIGRMAEALRHEPMPAPPTEFAWERPNRRRFARPRIWVAAGTVALCAILAIVALAPERSAAAILQRLLKSGVDIPVHTTLYHVGQNGELKVFWESYVYRDHAHLVPGGQGVEQFINGDREYDYYPDRNFALVKRITPRSGEAIFSDNSLRHLLDLRKVAEVKRTPGVEWRGMRLDRFDIRLHMTDALGQQLEATEVLYADTTTDRPYFLDGFVQGGDRGQFVHGARSAVEWSYPALDQVDFAVKIPKSARIYDEAAMREQVKEQVTGNLGEDTVGGIKVILRAVYAHEYGGLEVFTTGGTGRIERAPQGLRIDGKETEGAFSAGQNQGHWAGGSYREGGKFVFEPLEYRGLKLVYQEAGWMKVNVPDVIDLEVPVWKADASRLGRHFAGYAKFRHIVPIRYGGQILTDGVNRSVLLPPGESRTQGSSAVPATERSGQDAKSG